MISRISFKKEKLEPSLLNQKLVAKEEVFSLLETLMMLLLMIIVSHKDICIDLS